MLLSRRLHFAVFLLLSCEGGRASNRADRPVPPQPVATATVAPPAAPKPFVLAVPDSRSWPRRHGSLAVPPTHYERAAGDGCGTPRVFPTHGFLDRDPVHGTVSLRAKSVVLELVSIASETKRTYRGTLEESVCGTQSLEYSGKIGTSDGPHARLSFSLALPWSPNPPTNSDSQRTRLEVEGREGPDELNPMLKLWNAPNDPKSFLEPYRKALRSAVDLQAVVQIPKGSTFVAYSPAGSPTLRLAELAGSPLAVKRSIETGLSCETGDDCSAKLACHDIGAESFVLVVSLRGKTSRGQGNFRSSHGELWTWTPDGFKLGAGLPDVESHDSAHGRRASRTGLYWVDGDGKAPLEILVKHTDSQDEEGPGFGLLAFDPAEKTYRPIDAMPKTSRETLNELSYINALAEF